MATIEHMLVCPNCGTELPRGAFHLTLADHAILRLCPVCQRYFCKAEAGESAAAQRERLVQSLRDAVRIIDSNIRHEENERAPLDAKAAHIEAHARVFRESRLEEVYDAMQPIEARLRDLRAERQRMIQQIQEL